MTVIGVSMVKDEEDIIGATVVHMLGQVDHLIVADNMSTDRTREILSRFVGPYGEGRLTIVDDHEVGYWQSEKMTKLARMAYEMGAHWVVPFDADEIWTSQFGRLGDVIEACTDYGLVTAELYDHVVTSVDPTVGDAIDRIPWRRQHCLPLPKVACRAHPELVVEQGNHWGRYPVPGRPTEAPRIVIHHYPYRSSEQLIRKARNGGRAYALAEGLPDNVGAHWRSWHEKSDEWLIECFREYYYREDPYLPHPSQGEALVHDPPRRPHKF